MPHLVHRNIALRISGDELFFPFIVYAFGKLLWLVLSLTILVVEFNNYQKCADNKLILAFLFLSVFCFIVSLSSDLSIVSYSTQGTIVETQRRKPLVNLLLWKATLGVIELLISIIGIVGLSISKQIPCNSTLERTQVNQVILSILVVAQASEFIGNAFCLGACISTVNIESAKHDLNDETWSQAVGRWEGHFRRISNYLPHNEEASGMLRELARAYANFFHSQGFVDIVASDIVAGLVLVRIEQADRRRRAFEEHKTRLLQMKESSVEEKKALIGAERTVDFTPEEKHEEHKQSRRYICTLPHGQLRQIANVFEGMVETEDVNLLQEVAAVSLYATMTYTQANILSDNERTTNFLRLFTLDRGIQYWLCAWFGSRLHGEGMNFWAVDNSGLHIRRKQLTDTTLVYTDTENDVLHKPTSLYVNMSVEDAVTDCMTDPASLSEAGQQWGFNGENRWAHYGILQVTVQLRRTLQETQLLEKTIAKHPGFELIITGHSLGAGIAVILTLLMRRDFPTVRCIAYGVPGALVDPVTADECEEYVTSVVVGNDLVPRMSFPSICLLRDQILDAIARAKINKTEILRTVYGEDHPSEELLYPADEVPDSLYKRSIDKFKAEKQPTLDEMRRQDLCLPGRIIHFVKIRSQQRLGALDSEYAMTFAEPEDFKEIAVSSTMVTDHLPARYYAQLRKLVKKTMKRPEEIRK